MPTHEDEPRDAEQVGGLEKGLLLIEAFDARHPKMTLSEAARAVGLSPASARRCLRTLVALGYARSDGKYFRLAPRVLRLGHAYVMTDDLARRAQPVLESLSERAHESASLGVLDGDEVVFVARATARRSLSSGVGVGTRLPAHCSAIGRVLLAALEPAQLRERLAGMPLNALTPHTVTDPRRITRLVAAARQQGYAVSEEEIELGLRSMAVPIRDDAGEVVAAMSLAVRTSRLSAQASLQELLPALDAARRTLMSTN